MNLKVLLLLVAFVGESAFAEKIVQKNIENITNKNMTKAV